MMYSKGTVAPSRNEYKKVILMVRVLKVESRPEKYLFVHYLSESFGPTSF